MLLSSPSVTEVVLAIALLVATVAAALWIASRIYSAGVLLYGQRVGLRSVLRATRVAR
jgi:ABC-type Na+ efflux pump permease subunit